MAEEFWEDAANEGMARSLRYDYVIDKLEEKGVEINRYNITFDYMGNADVEAK